MVYRWAARAVMCLVGATLAGCGGSAGTDADVAPAADAGSPAPTQSFRPAGPEGGIAAFPAEAQGVVGAVNAGTAADASSAAALGFGSGAAPTSASPSQAAAGVAAPADDWVLDRLDLRDVGGFFAGTGRIICHSRTGGQSPSFVVTLYQDDRPVGTLTGRADAVAAGATITVELQSTSPHVLGVTRWELRTYV